MKRQIRQGVFETNSSNEHSLTIINDSDFKKWKDGKLLARVTSVEEDKNCSGNFWSTLLNFEFTDNFQAAKADNDTKLQELKNLSLENAEKNRERLGSTYKHIRAYFENFSFRNFDRYYSRINEGIWISYQEFIKEFKEDCYSMFEHDDLEHSVHVIGKYSHS